MSNKVVTRFSPSPTGKFHLGGFRTALYNYLYAKQNGGKFILRIEDTDRTRYDSESEQDILNNLKLFNIKYDEKYIQSERLDIYRKYADKLINKGLAYYCTCKSNDDECSCKYNSTPLIPYTIKIDFPKDETIKFHDKVRGDILWNSKNFKSQIIIKSDGFPTYHFAVVIDDHLMGITHVMRGDEWISSTPKHTYLYKLLGWKEPTWVHLPVLLNQTGGKMSKRYGDYSVSYYLKIGYLPDTLLNYISLLGWHPSSNEELFDMNKLIEQFSINRISKSPAIFDINKLNWYNKKYINKDESIDYIKQYLTDGYIMDDDYLINKIDYYKQSCNTLLDLQDSIMNYFNRSVDSKLKNHFILSSLYNFISANKIDNVEQYVENLINTYSLSKKDTYSIIRLALTGKESGKSILSVLKLSNINYIKERLWTYL